MPEGLDNKSFSKTLPKIRSTKDMYDSLSHLDDNRRLAMAEDKEKRARSNEMLQEATEEKKAQREEDLLNIDVHHGPFGERLTSARSAEQAFKDSLKLGDRVKVSEQRQRSQNLIHTRITPAKK